MLGVYIYIYIYIYIILAIYMVWCPKPYKCPMVRYLIIENVFVYNSAVDIDVSVDTLTFNESNIKLYG